jgi:type II secretory pathway pseudopilin PulG
MKFLKKAAMFGLDARIALAIFGALSVISGAALYSAIQSAKAEQWRQYFNERVKATEAYLLDNGQKFSIYNETNLWLSSANLVKNLENFNTWNGPYISYVSSADDTFIRDKETRSISNNTSWNIMLKQSSTWTSMATANSGSKCAENNIDCSEWIVLHSGGSSDTEAISKIFKMLDDLVDSNDGSLAGKVRMSDDYRIFYKSIPHIYI